MLILVLLIGSLNVAMADGQALSARIALGGSIPWLDADLDFDDDAVVSGVAGQVVSDELNMMASFAASLSIRYDLMSKFGVGFAIDYYIMPIENAFIETRSSLGAVAVAGDFGSAHVFSLAPFIEFRYPIQSESFTITPYAQAGVGLNINTFSDDVDFDTISLAVHLALGFEISLTKTMGLFFEGKWHYNVTDFTFDPASNYKFKGEADLSNVSVLVGMSFNLF